MSMNRRVFSAAAASVAASAIAPRQARAKSGIRLGGPVFEKTDSAEAWAKAVAKLGYAAAYCPLGFDADDKTVEAYKRAAREADIVIAEVGAWSNPIDPDPEKRNAAIDKCKRGLALADRIGALCCVNISGSRNPERWDSHHPDNYSQATFDLIVKTTQDIIDSVNPDSAYFTLETMPWALPDSLESYQALIEAIDRDHFGVHFDPVNLINSPRRYYSTGELISECLDALGPRLISCHAKDILLSDKLTVHLDEARSGLGGLDYETFIQKLAAYPHVPLMLEHLPNAEEYRLAAEHVRSVARRIGDPFYGE